MNCPTDAKGAVVWFSNARQGGLSVFPSESPVVWFLPAH